MPSAVRPKSVTATMFGMVEPGRGFGLALEAARDLVEAAELGVQELERQLLLEHHVLDAIDGAHAAATERRRARGSARR